MAATDLYALAREFLDAAAAALVTAPAGAISRAYVSPGPPAYDCEQLTVHVGGPAEGATAPLSPPLQPGFRTVGEPGVVNLVAMTATVLRCVPVLDETGEPPAAAALDAAAADVLGDCWAIWNYLRQQHRAGVLFRRPDGEPREFLFAPAVALNTSGGFAGFEVQILVQLEGYA